MAVFDIRTLYVVWSITSLTLSVTMVFYSYSRKTYPGFGLLTLSMVCLGASSLLIGLRHMVPDFPRIRDDRGYWNVLESYLEDHSDILFSRGMCPECSDKLYKNEAWYIKMKKRRRNG